MINKIRSQVESILKEKIIRFEESQGGRIATGESIIMADGRSFFLKHSSGTSFIPEANGLQELARANCIKIPKVIAASDHFLLLERILPGTIRPDFFIKFGKQLAHLHKKSADTFGFKEDNFIGSTPQVNLPATNKWTTFYFEKRLMFQLELAQANGFATHELTKAIQHIGNNIKKICGESLEKPSLLHGDLWSGNFLCDKKNNPVLIDPAIYYGHREADLAMTKLFGGFPDVFYDAYQAEFPLNAGYKKREALYKLYHMLNHLNLFGRSYYSSCLSLALQYSD